MTSGPPNPNHESGREHDSIQGMLDRYAFAGDGERLITIDRTFRSEPGKPNTLRFAPPENQAANMQAPAQTYHLEPGVPVIAFVKPRGSERRAFVHTIELLEKEAPQKRNLFPRARRAKPLTILVPRTENFAIIDTDGFEPKVAKFSADESVADVLIPLDSVEWVKVARIGEDFHTTREDIWDSPAVRRMSPKQLKEMGLPGRLFGVAMAYYDAQTQQDV